MRKISLSDGRLSVDILPDCGGALCTLRWRAPAGQIYDILRPANARTICDRVADRLSCLPITPFGDSGGRRDMQSDLAEWTVQDASNVRATLTVHKELAALDAHSSAPHWSCQILQRFALAPDGLRVQLTVTNVGVQPMPARIGLRLRLMTYGQMIIRGQFEPVAPAGTLDRGATPPSAEMFAAGFCPAQQDIHLYQRCLGNDIRIEWPHEKLRVTLSLVQGLEYVRLDYDAAQRELWLSPISHANSPAADTPSIQILQQGDSLEASMILFPAIMGS